MIRQRIYDDMKAAMLARDTQKLNVLRFVISEIKNREIDAKHELTDDEVIEVLRRETKRRSESVAQYEAGGRADIAETEKQELAIIDTYLPQLMDAAAIEAVVDQVVTANAGADFGQVMRVAMAQLKGQADGKMVSEAVKKKLG